MVLKGVGFTNGIIILEEPEAVYYSGQVLSGNVHFELNYAVNCTGLNVTCLGEALVLRTEKRYEIFGGFNRCREIKYEGREKYINLVQCVFGNNDTLTTLAPGVHSMPFQFQVPINAPSSLEGVDGSISYSITASLEVPQMGGKEELVKQFQVVAPIGPDTLAKMMRPLELDFEEIKTCQCFCASKPINLKIGLPSAALEVGSVVPITVQVQNNSSIEIYEICFRITKRHKYRTLLPPSEYCSAEETLVEMKKGSVLSGMRRQYCWALALPPVLLPNLQHCGVIDVVYYFKVKVVLTDCNDPVEEEAEVMIGVLPDTSMTSPDLAGLLPKAPVPDQTQKPVIGFIAANTPPMVTSVPSIVNSGCPYPTSDCPYPTVPPYNPDVQPTIAIVPSAPPLLVSSTCVNPLDI